MFFRRKNASGIDVYLGNQIEIGDCGVPNRITAFDLFIVKDMFFTERRLMKTSRWESSPYFLGTFVTNMIQS